MTTMRPRTIARHPVRRPGGAELLYASTPARLAYSGLDGAPRVIPIGW